MEFNNKTILISGLVILSLVAMYFSYKDIALAIAGGLVGYLSKDVVSVDPQVVPVDPLSVSVDNEVDEEDIQDYGSDSETAWAYDWYSWG